MAVNFPPRDETFDFVTNPQTSINADYREAGRGAVFFDHKTQQDIHVDMEGLVVWLEGYLRRRVNGEGHDQATKNTRNEARQELGLNPL